MSFEINNYCNFNFNINFSVNQKNVITNETVLFNCKNKELIYQIQDNNYTYELLLNNFSDDKENLIIILSRDNAKILEYSLNQLNRFNILEEYDILLVDDRSESEDILDLSKQYSTSYLRIDNTKDIFNYSMLNNIATLYAQYFNKKRCIFYNNDLWPRESHSLKNILHKHIELKSQLTGCRLIYPSEKEYADIGKPQHILDKFIHSSYNTIQHGGIYFGLKMSPFIDNRRHYLNSEIVLGPIHQWRFYPHNHHLACSDQKCFAVTGALQIIDVEDFIQIGGFNTSMSTAFQDIDLCCKMLANKLNVNYIGSEFMVHAESLTHAKHKITKTQYHTSDNLCWDYMWGYQMPHLVGYQYE